MLDRWLFRRIDNSPLIIFRFFFGVLISLECYGAILTGWVRRTLVEPAFTFNFIGFDWLQVFVGPGMYVYFFVMGSLGIAIALGFRYRISMIGFTLMWTTVYLMQKTSYNNHYYLLIIISFFMCFFPAHHSHSLDVKRNPALKSDSMYSYVKWLLVLQLFIVYTYAALAKVYGDWLHLRFIELLMGTKAHYLIIGGWLQQTWVLYCVAVIGIVFDLLIIPALLWKPSRKIAFICAIGFHLFNSIVFQIGIFPYLSLAFTVFFFETETIRKIFFRKKQPFTETQGQPPDSAPLLRWGWGLFLFVQLILPVRHYFIEDDVLWTEEGHRMSWRMMLRSRVGEIEYKVVDKKSGKVSMVNPEQYLSYKQDRRLAAYPDFIWQFAQILKKEYAKNGQDVAVYANAQVSINGRPLQPFIDPKVDLGGEPWKHWEHHDWILPSPLHRKGPAEAVNP